MRAEVKNEIGETSVLIVAEAETVEQVCNIVFKIQDDQSKRARGVNETQEKK